MGESKAKGEGVKQRTQNNGKEQSKGGGSKKQRDVKQWRE